MRSLWINDGARPAYDEPPGSSAFAPLREQLPCGECGK